MDLNRRDEENAMSIARLIENISKERMAMDLAEIIVRTANRLEDSSLDDQIQKKQGLKYIKTLRRMSGRMNVEFKKLTIVSYLLW